MTGIRHHTEFVIEPKNMKKIVEIIRNGKICYFLRLLELRLHRCNFHENLYNIQLYV